MKTLIKSLLCLSLLPATLAYAGPGDKEVLFTVPYNLTKIDPFVTKLRIECAISDQNKQPIVNSMVDLGAVTNGAKSGQQGIKVTVPGANAAQAKNWYCRAWLGGADGKFQIAITDMSQNTNAPAWSVVAPGSKTRADGTF